MVFVSGQGPFDPATGDVVGETIEEQTRQCLRNVEAILKAAGSTMDDVVQATFILLDESDFAGMNEEWNRWFPTNPPARQGQSSRSARRACESPSQPAPPHSARLSSAHVTLGDHQQALARSYGPACGNVTRAYDTSQSVTRQTLPGGPAARPTRPRTRAWWCTTRPLDQGRPRWPERGQDECPRFHHAAGFRRSPRPILRLGQRFAKTPECLRAGQVRRRGVLAKIRRGRVREPRGRRARRASATRTPRACRAAASARSPPARP